MRTRIKRASGFVEEQNSGVANQGPGDGDPLLLSTTETDATAADLRVVSVGEGDDEIVDVSIFSTLVKLLLSDLGWVDPEEDVFSYCTYGARG